MEKNKIKVGILTMSDGRPYLHAEYEALNFQYQHEIAAVLEASGNFEVIEGRQVINTNTAAKEEGMRLLQAGAEMTIFNGWCAKYFSGQADLDETLKGMNDDMKNQIGNALE